MNKLDDLIGHFETHDVLAIRKAFEDGVDPNQLHKGKPLVYELINMYLRSPRFKDCMRVFVDYGLVFDDELLLAVLLDDGNMLAASMKKEDNWRERTYTLDCAFTPLYKSSLLHICAEYNHPACARLLLEKGIDVNVIAGGDEHGFGGHTPIFHTVNQHQNNSFEMLQLLLEYKADVMHTVKGLIWGKGYSWETFIAAVNPVSYAMMGLLPQFQRKEKDIYNNVSILMNACYGISYTPPNIPNRYLNE